jgi:hypothetical protein
MHQLVKHGGLWAAIYVALVLGILSFGVLGTYDVNQRDRRSDEELTAEFFAHEAVFDELVKVLAAGPGGNAEIYKRLLRQISVADARYFPDSGKLILVPDGQENLEPPSRFYVYLPHGQPQSFLQNHGYYWRGPGVDIVTRDLPLKAGWYIRHDTTIEVAVTPY